MLSLRDLRFKNLLIFITVMLVVAALVWVPTAGNAQDVKIKKVVIKHSDPASGQQMYADYCAPCHGITAKGNGPAGPALKEPATNLTQLAKNNDGKYPAAHVRTVLQFGTSTAAHGSKDMPIWGPLFHSLNSGRPTSRADTQLRISNLNRYLESIQEK